MFSIVLLEALRVGYFFYLDNERTFCPPRNPPLQTSWHICGGSEQSSAGGFESGLLLKLDLLTELGTLCPPRNPPLHTSGHIFQGSDHACFSWLVGESMVCKSVFFGIDLSLALNGVLR